MKKVGSYLLTAVPLAAGLGIQMVCSMLGGMLYGIYYGMRAAVGGDRNEAMSQDAMMAGYSGIIIYVLIISQIVALIVFGIWYRKQNKDKRKRWNRQTIGIKTAGSILFLGIGLQLLTNLFMQLVYIILPEVINRYSRLVETAGIGQMDAVSMLATVILAPVAEEIIFRGVTLNLAKRAGAVFIAANLIQAVAFGIYHLNWLQGVYAAVLGLILGYVAHRYDSLYPAVFLHLTYNLSATLLNAVGEGLPDTAAMQAAVVGITALALFVGIWLLRTDGRERMKKEESWS